MTIGLYWKVLAGHPQMLADGSTCKNAEHKCLRKIIFYPERRCLENLPANPVCCSFWGNACLTKDSSDEFLLVCVHATYFMNHKLLVVVEDGMNSLTTLVYAAKACACAESPEEGGIVILYVLPPLLSSISGMGAAMVKKLADRVQADRKRTAMLVLEEMKQRAIQEGVRPGFVQIEVAENTGDTLQQILRTGKRHVCDTIVVGRNDGALLKHFFAGSLITRLLWKPIGFTIWIVENDSLPEFK